jgi:replication factor C subunit 2/4
MAEQPWIEKYRPKSLKDVTSQSTTTNILEKSLKSANLPHMLFYGPPGTGKTSTILALAHELYGPNLIHSRVLELNASDERGISIVRDRIKNFARLAVSNPSTEDKEKYPCPPYKLIILDEADSMTTDAQSALRRTMENYANVTRFCLICNYVTKIIDPLASRCSKFRFRSLDKDLGIKRLQFIVEQENLDIKTDAIIEILDVCEGDLRRAVNLLQCVSTVLDNSTNFQIKQLFGHLPDDLIIKTIEILKSKNFSKIINFTESNLIRDGYSAAFILSALHENLLLKNTELSNYQKNKIALILWDSDKSVSIGCNENIQILNCMFKLCNVL